MPHLFDELKRRKVFRTGIAYVIAAWVVVQVVETIMPSFGFSDTVVRVVVLALAAGLPLALVVSWVYDISPEGFKRDAYAGPPVLLGSQSEAQTDPPSKYSIVVLPFLSMSDDPSNEYFSDGISEELLNLLTRVPDLRVISRTSAFAYKDKSMRVGEIARELNVANVLEGSVRKDGNNVRITAQLIDARTDMHLWSRTFEREFESIFAIQDEIAAAVVDELRVKIIGDPPTVSRTSPDAYALHLQSKHLAQLQTAESVRKAVDLRKEALKIDPTFAAAWLGLSNDYTNLDALRLMPSQTARELSRKALDHALQHAPNLAYAHDRLAWDNFVYRGDLSTAARCFSQALHLEPANTAIIGNISMFLSALGRFAQAIRFGQFQISRDPANPNAYTNLGIRYRMAGKYKEANMAFSKAITLSPSVAGVYHELGGTLVVVGDIESAETAFQKEPLDVFRKIGLAMTCFAKSDETTSDQLMKDVIQEFDADIAYYVAQVMAYRGDSDKAFEWLDKAKEANNTDLFDVISEPLLANLHDDHRWLPFLKSIGRSPEQLAAIEFEVELPALDTQ